MSSRGYENRCCVPAPKIELTSPVLLRRLTSFNITLADIFNFYLPKTPSQLCHSSAELGKISRYGPIQHSHLLTTFSPILMTAFQLRVNVARVATVGVGDRGFVEAHLPQVITGKIAGRNSGTAVAVLHSSLADAPPQHALQLFSEITSFFIFFFLTPSIICLLYNSPRSSH